MTHPVSCDENAAVALDAETLGRLMPMFMTVDCAGLIHCCGPTLRKIAGMPLVGRRFSEVFELVYPRHLGDVGLDHDRNPLRLSLQGSRPTALKGQAVRLPDGWLLWNLAFGSELREAVQRHGLTASDFAATELAFDLLYLAEANAAVIAEARKFSTRLHEARAQALEQALSDPLTGLTNRRGLDQALARFERDGRGFGLVHLDLDHFKQINDSLGHAAGDSVLTAVAARIRSVIRESDIAARIGGDEFVVLVAGPPGQSRLEEIAQRLLAAIIEPVPADRIGDAGSAPIRVSASLGVVTWDGTGKLCGTQLLQKADEALYRSKDAGRGRVTVAG